MKTPSPMRRAAIALAVVATACALGLGLYTACAGPEAACAQTMPIAAKVAWGVTIGSGILSGLLGLFSRDSHPDHHEVSKPTSRDESEIPTRYQQREPDRHQFG